MYIHDNHPFSSNHAFYAFKQSLFRRIYLTCSPYDSFKINGCINAQHALLKNNTFVTRITRRYIKHFVQTDYKTTVKPLNFGKYYILQI